MLSEPKSYSKNNPSYDPPIIVKNIINDKEQFESKTSCGGDIMCYPNLLSFGHQINIETFLLARNAAPPFVFIDLNVETIENRQVVNILFTR